MSARKLIALSSAFLVGAVVFSAFDRPQPTRPNGEPRTVPAGPPAPPYATGWIDDPAAVDDVVSSLGCGRFSETAAFSTCDDNNENVFLWEPCREATGDVLPARDQKSVGSCVGFAAASAIEHLQCVQIAGGSGEVYRDLAPEVIYGGSRVQIGGGRIRGDGSVGAWAARFVAEYGVVPRGIIDGHDLRFYDETRCRDLGRFGLSKELLRAALQHPVRSVTRVLSWAECRSAIRNGYPVMVCSSQGFGLERDEDGFCPPRGVWYHAMAVIGVRGGKRPGGFLLNSWGSTAHSGPRFPKDAPTAGFWCDADVLDRMLRQGDSWAFSRVVGFPADSRKNATHRSGDFRERKAPCLSPPDRWAMHPCRETFRRVINPWD